MNHKIFCKSGPGLADVTVPWQAVWYTSRRADEGPVFGSADNWNGLGVFFDSFDNDGLHNNPYISVMLNDGSKSYDHDTYATASYIS